MAFLRLGMELAAGLCNVHSKQGWRCEDLLEGINILLSNI
jgi:hypothetical protein